MRYLACLGRRGVGTAANARGSRRVPAGTSFAVIALAAAERCKTILWPCEALVYKELGCFRCGAQAWDKPTSMATFWSRERVAPHGQRVTIQFFDPSHHGHTAFTGNGFDSMFAASAANISGGECGRRPIVVQRRACIRHFPRNFIGDHGDNAGSA